MQSSIDQTLFDELFKMLEPEAASMESRFSQCRRKLFKFFVWRRCEDPESLADETIVRLLKNVNNGQQISSQRPYSYVYGIASNVFQEYLRVRRKNVVVTDLSHVADRAFTPDEDGCGPLCLKKLDPEKRELLVHYYLDNEDRDKIAEEQVSSINALRLKIHRIKQELRRCWEECQRRSEN